LPGHGGAQVLGQLVFSDEYDVQLKSIQLVKEVFLAKGRAKNI
jgi:hypothetical protein